VSKGEDVLCRVHVHCVGAHVFNSTECTCREEMASAQSLIEKEGRGVIIWLDQEGKGNGHLALIESARYKDEGFSQAEAYIRAGFAADARDYRPAAEILADLEIRSIRLISGSPQKADELRRSDVVVSGLVQA
jgi:GTP cyclohydrolase II